MNASSVQKLGLPFVQALNNGMVPKFAKGRLVGGSSKADNVGTNSIKVSVDSDAISKAVEDGITKALSNNSVSVDVGTAKNEITNAITTAFSNINLPAVKLDNDTVKLDAPDKIPLDVSALKNAGPQALGADVRRVDALEGNTHILKEDISSIEKRLSSVENSGFTADIDRKIEDVRKEISPIKGKVEILDSKIEAQKGEVLNAAFAQINEQLNNYDSGTKALKNDIKIASAQVNSVLDEIRRRLATAESQANAAMAQALAVRS